MTSGVIVSVVVFSLYDHLCPPAMALPALVGTAILVQLSLTHGYLPYGSSDVLLPSLVAFIWSVELLPRYGGVVDVGQYKFWIECAYTVIVGFLLRIVDVKRANKSLGTNLMRLLAVISIFPFSWSLGYTDPVILFGLFAFLAVCYDPALGHIFWHFGSSYSLFAWWYMLRLRPGDHNANPASLSDTPLMTICLGIVVKNAIRRLAMMAPLKQEAQNLTMYFFEHTLFSVWGYYTVVVQEPLESWLYDTVRCWSGPSYPSALFQLYYLMKVATHVEDTIYIAKQIYFPVIEENTKRDDTVIEENTEEISSLSDATITTTTIVSQPDSASSMSAKAKAAKDPKMLIHHVTTTALCVLSWYSGYTRIGAIVMIAHDCSDAPLDITRLCGRCVISHPTTTSNPYHWLGVVW